VGEGFSMGAQSEGSANSAARSMAQFARFGKDHRTTVGLVSVALVSVAGMSAFAMSSTPTPKDGRSIQVEAAGQQASIQDNNRQETQLDKAANNEPSKSSNSNKSETTVTVNGQAVPVPTNGTYDKTTTDADGTTRVQVTSDTMSEQGSTSSSVELHIQSESRTTSED
jgi:hypothetical protein